MAKASKPIRLSKAVKEFNVGILTIVEFLTSKGFDVENKPNTKISSEMYDVLVEEFQSEKTAKEESYKVGLEHTLHETITLDNKVTTPEDFVLDKEPEDLFIKQTTSIEPEKKVVEPKKEKPKEVKVKKEEAKKEVAKKTGVKETVEIKKDEIKKDEVEEIVKKEPEVKEEIKKTPKVLGKLDIEKISPKKKTVKSKKAEKEKVAEKTVDVEEKKAETPQQEPDLKEKKEPETKEIKETEEIVEVDKKTPETDNNFLKTKYTDLKAPKVLGKIELPKIVTPVKKPVASSSDARTNERKKKRKRIKKTPKPGQEKKNLDVNKVVKTDSRYKGKKRHKPIIRAQLSEEDIQKQVKETLLKLTSAGKSKSSKYRKQKRELVTQQVKEEQQKIEDDKKIIKVTEFVTVNELATMIKVTVTEIISTCMSLGLFVSINQRLDAETLTIVAEEFKYQVEFVSVEVQEAIKEEEDKPEDLVERSAIVTVMGHVDHGKTSLLDYIRHANVIAGEAGGITQHIGAYEVKLESGKAITFLDTPGHEAFTAMRARGAKITDVAVIVIAADDNVMPQTKEAINHAQAAGVPIVFAINKIDKSNSNPEKIKEELANLNILVEDWGGKYQSQEISAKKGVNVDLLLEKVLFESELLELKANPNKLANGTILESSLDKGRGYITKLVIQNGTLKVGDMVLAGYCYGKVKAMYNERNKLVEEAGPSSAILMLGLNGAPQAGDSFNVMTNEHETKLIATKRLQLQREQGLRTQKHITLDEIGRRIAIGDFKELNVIIKGDVDGSVEALSDSLINLSTDEVQVNVIHKAVGQITEGDVLLASASNAVVIGFQVRPSVSARKLAQQEQIDIRLYSVIYQAIEEIKSAIEGMLSPDIEEKVLCNVEIREIFKITKVGTIAGCMVLDGKISRNTKVHLIRDGIVIYTGNLGSLKRFKDDVKDVSKGFECGLNIENFNDIKEKDIIEGYEEIEVKRKL